MLCSVGKSSSNNWLDRLRSSKGFPVAGDLSLDHFLNNHHNPNLTPNNSSDTNISGSLASKSGSTRSDEKPVPQINQPAEISTTGDDDGEKEWFGIMTNVLSELFNMGDSDSIENSNSTLSRKKSSRKQTNPRFCVLPSIESKSIDRRDEEGVAAAAAAVEIEKFTRNDVNCTENEDRMMMKKEGNVECLDGEDEKCNGGGDLLSLGYSKSEVTIIDTSCASWKFDKLLFRKKNVWKVRDKKGRSRNVGRKRKAMPSDEDVVGGKKIAKVSMISPPFYGDGNGADCVVPLNEGRNPQNDKREEMFQETPNILGQIPEKRFQFPRSARKTSKGGTSGVHKKGVC